MIVSKPFQGVRVDVMSTLKFNEVLERLRSLVGQTPFVEFSALYARSIDMPAFMQAVRDRFIGASDFMLFFEFVHGGWLQKFGISRRCVRWILGNPLIAITMIEHDLTAGLFDPVEMLIAESDDCSATVVTYVQRSTLFVIEDCPPLRDAAITLDEKYAALVANATKSEGMTWAGDPTQRNSVSVITGRRKTTSFAIMTWTTSSRWFRVSLRTVTMPRSGLDREGAISTISLSTHKVSPGRVGRGHWTSTPAARMPSASGRPDSTFRRIVVTTVCQPLAARPPNRVSFAAASSR